jgi:hypothetical protein
VLHALPLYTDLIVLIIFGEGFIHYSPLRDLREIGWDGVDWIDMAQERDQWRVLVNTVLNLRVP